MARSNDRWAFNLASRISGENLMPPEFIMSLDLPCQENVVGLLSVTMSSVIRPSMFLSRASMVRVPAGDSENLTPGRASNDGADGWTFLRAMCVMVSVMPNPS